MDHSIVICTRNRPNWIKYCLNFYKEFNYNGKIYITDDSDDNIYQINKKNIENFKNVLSINHEIGSGKNLKKRHQRLILSRYDIIKKVNTKYFSIMTDDDFLFPNFLNNAIKFLEKNNDYSAVNGVSAVFYFDKSYEIKKINNLYWPDNDELDPIDRLMKYLEPEFVSLPTIGVMKNSLFNDVYLLEKELKYKIGTRENLEGIDTIDEEIPIVSQIIISGKIKTLNELASFISKTEYNSLLDNEERVENLQFVQGEEAEKYKPYRLGPIQNILNNSISPALIQTKNELNELIKLKGSKYSNHEISDQLDFFLYRIIRAHNGYLKYDNTDFFKKYSKQKLIQRKLYFNFKIINLYYFFKYNKYKKIILRIKNFIANLEINKKRKQYINFHQKNKNIL